MVIRKAPHHGNQHMKILLFPYLPHGKKELLARILHKFRLPCYDFIYGRNAVVDNLILAFLQLHLVQQFPFCIQRNEGDIV